MRVCGSCQILHGTELRCEQFLDMPCRKKRYAPDSFVPQSADDKIDIWIPASYHNRAREYYSLTENVPCERCRFSETHSDRAVLGAFVFNAQYAGGLRARALASRSMLYSEMTMEPSLEDVQGKITHADVFVNFRANATFTHRYYDHGYGGDLSLLEHIDQACGRPAPDRASLRPAIAAFVSNCQPEKVRFLREINSVFPVHNYGGCAIGNERSWQRIETAASLNRHEQKGAVLKHYAFVAAFENIATVDEYVSEKLFDAYLGDAIPVYRGAPDAESQLADKVVPTHSCIWANKYGSGQDLGAALKALYSDDNNADDSEFARYHAWRHQSQFCAEKASRGTAKRQQWQCALCDKVWHWLRKPECSDEEATTAVAVPQPQPRINNSEKSKLHEIAHTQRTSSRDSTQTTVAVDDRSKCMLVRMHRYSDDLDFVRFNLDSFYFPERDDWRYIFLVDRSSYRVPVEPFLANLLGFASRTQAGSELRSRVTIELFNFSDHCDIYARTHAAIMKFYDSKQCDFVMITNADNYYNMNNAAFDVAQVVAVTMHDFLTRYHHIENHRCHLNQLFPELHDDEENASPTFNEKKPNCLRPLPFCQKVDLAAGIFNTRLLNRTAFDEILSPSQQIACSRRDGLLYWSACQQYRCVNADRLLFSHGVTETQTNAFTLRKELHVSS